MTAALQELRQVALVSALRRSQLFAGAAPGELAAIAEIAVLKHLPKGAYLFHEGENATGFYVVQTGAINVHRVNASGKEQVIHVFRAGESFAEGTVATDKGYPADARAVEDSQILLIQKSGFLGLIKRQPELALRMLASMGAHLRVLVGQLEGLTLKDVQARLANWLVKRCPDQSSNVPIKIELHSTKRVLAAELGTVSETFSRTLASLREQGLVDVNGKSITVLCPQKLTNLLRRHLGE